MRPLRNIILAIAVIAAAGIGINAFAHGGMGRGGGMMGDYDGGGWGHHGPGWHQCYGYDNDSGVRWSDEDYRNFEQKRQAFSNETREIRSKLLDKERELHNELVKDNPDAARAAQLQKEISALRSEFDQKRVEHMVKLRKQYPNMGRGFMGGGPITGYGTPRGGSYCWN
ncbi:MAG: periplasmic heavy metal sensor [Deltaproteobacteria bacterium]|nr:periplasmic heavy metal sensor [Deltaproteobacteria bacterium]